MKNKLIKIFTFCILTFFYIFPAYCNNFVIVSEQTYKKDILKKIAVFEDKSAKLALKEIIKLSNQHKFKENEKGKSNFGITSSAIWLKFNITNKTSNFKKWIINIRNNRIATASLFLINRDKIIKQYHTGYSIDYKDKQIKDNEATFKISINKNEIYTVFIRLHTPYTLSIPITVYMPEEYEKRINIDSVFLGILIGMLLVLILYYAFVYFNLKDKSYLYFILLIVFWLLYQFDFFGISSKYFFPANKYLKSRFPLIILGNVIVFFYLFSIQIMRIRKYFKRILPYLYVIIIFSFSYSLLAIIPGTNIRVIYRYALIVSLIAIIVSYLSIFVYIKTKQRVVVYYIIAFSLGLAGPLLKAILSKGLLPFNYIAYYGMPITNTLAFLIFGYALTDKIRNSLLEKQRSNILVKENEELEKEIDLRKHAEHDLLKNKKDLERLFDVSPFPLAILTIEDIIVVRANKACEGFFQGKVEQTLGKTPDMFFNPIEQKFRLLDLLKERGLVENYETRFKTFENEERFALLSIYSTEYNDIPSYIVGIADITALKQAQLEIKQNEKMFRDMFNKHSAIMFITEQKTYKIIEANNAASNFYGYSNKEFKKMIVDDLNILPFNQVKHELKSGFAKNQKYFVFKHKLKNGEVKDVELHTTPILLQNRKVYFSIIHDITERVMYQKALRESEELHRFIAENTKDVLWVMDENLQLTYISSSVFDVHGYTQDEIKTMSIKELMTGKSFFNAMRALVMKLKKPDNNDKPLKIEIRFIKKNGEFFWAEINSNTLTNEKGELVRVVGSTRDITDRKLMEKEIIFTRDEAEKANRLKTEFMANLSHEIRTPMNAILGFSQILEKRITDEKQKEFLSIISASGKTLLKLINDILDISKIEAGKIDLNYSVADVRELINEIKNTFEWKIKEKGLDFIIRVSENVPDNLLIDELKMRQVLFNLVGNSVKFTENGYIKVSMDIEIPETDEIEMNLILNVEDTGIGIPFNRQEQIFHAFIQAASSHYSQNEGAGLGLAITKRLVELMNGKINLNSEPGRGSSFSVVIQNVNTSFIDFNDTEQDVELQQNIEEYNFKGTKVLIADDLKHNREVAKYFLELYGIEVYTAEQGNDAVKMCMNILPDIIFIDLIMPELDGFKAIETIKSTGQFNNIPILAVSPAENGDNKRRALQAGADFVLVKPVTRTYLLKIISEAIKTRQ